MHFIWSVYAAHMLGYWVTVLGTIAWDVEQCNFLCAKKVMTNMTAWTIPAVALFAWLVPDYSHLSLAHGLWQLPGCVLLTDVLFYYPHRALHSFRSLYALHKAHHRWRRTMGMAALYADPFEHLVVNTTPPLAAALLLHAHPWVVAAWACIASANTVIAHAKEGQHIDHHFHHNKNFGVGLMLCDRLHGTLLAV
ncbi:MAG: hypothetical protein CL450_05890 [Acidimicrobiaceae bacterium]|nr:hypothetical protein [Acidimicrobiaceae bacterium]